jgi:hypothetical protein
MVSPLGMLWHLRFKGIEQQATVSSSTSNTNRYYTAGAHDQYAIATATRLTDSTIKALVNSILTLIDSNGGIQNPISLDAIKSYLAQRHDLNDHQM